MYLHILSEVGPTAQLCLSESPQTLQTSACVFPILFFLPCLSLRFRQQRVCFFWTTLETPLVCDALLCWELRLSALPVVPLYRGQGGIMAHGMPSMGISTCMDLKSVQQPTTFTFSRHQAWKYSRSIWTTPSDTWCEFWSCPMQWQELD